MGSSDWTELTDGLNSTTVDRGVTNGIARPNGGGNFIFGFNSLTTSEGAVGFFCNQANFAPMAKGASIFGAVQRGAGGGNTNFAPFLMVGIQGTSVNDEAYMLGLGDDDPHHIVLKKGVIASGLDDLAPDAPNNGILLRSNDTYDPETWLHLRLDMIVNLNGDVLLQCFENDLTVNAVTAPSWSAISGMTEFIDDALQINSGSAPFTSGRGGFGFYTKDVTSRSYFDHVVVSRQL
jgi:hypothetical protein